MKQQLRFFYLVCTIIALSCAMGCSSDENLNSGDNNNDEGTGSPELVSTCGIVESESLQQSIDEGKAEAVDVEVIQSDLVIVTRLEGEQAGNSQLVKLHGVTSNGVRSGLVAGGIDIIEQQTGRTAYVVTAGANCGVTVTGGGQGVLGQIFNSSGENINELLVQNAAVAPSNDGCLGDQLAACYSTLAVEEPVSDDVIDDFLWKPVSDSDGKLVVLANPFGATVLVNGTETLRGIGPGNGRGTQARASKSGCSYGNNVKVEFFDSSGKRILLKDGREFVTVPSGCSRYEFLL